MVRSARVSAEGLAWREQLEALERDVRRWTGNHAGICEVGEDELVRLLPERPPAVAELERDAITLVGEDVRRLLGAVRRALR